MTKHKTVLVAGATGYLGRFVVAELHRRGYKVRAITRSRERAVSPGPWDSPSLDGLVDDWAVGEVTNPAFIADVAEGADDVISALGVTKQKANPWDIDYQANLAVLRSAEKHGVKHFCFVNVIGGDQCPAQLTRAKDRFRPRTDSLPDIESDHQSPRVLLRHDPDSSDGQKGSCLPLPPGNQDQSHSRRRPREVLHRPLDRRRGGHMERGRP